MTILNFGRRVGMIAVIACCQAAGAADLFNVTAVVGTQSGTVGLQTVNQVFDELREQNLTALAPGYSGTEVTSINVDFRGLGLDMAYPVAGGSRLDLNIPRLGITKSFFGSTREDSRQQLRDYFKNGDTLGRIMQALAELSSVDPIAGNPASLQSRMVAGNFSRNFRLLAAGASARALGNDRVAFDDHPVWVASTENDLPALGTQDRGGAGLPSSMVGLNAARYTSRGLSSTVASLPFSHAFDTGPERPLSLDGELQYTNAEGAETYGVNVDVAYRAHVEERWYLVPSVAFGISGSRDLGSVGQIASAALTSAFRLYQSADYALWMGNAIDATRTLSVSIGGYSFDPKLHNVVFTNGLLLSTTPSALMQQYWMEYSFADTRYTGSALYDRRYDEVGVAMVRAFQSSWGATTVRARLSYLDTSNSRGVALQLQMTF